MLTSLSAILAPVVIGTFLPTAQLKIDDQKMYMRVTCTSDLQCSETQKYVDQGYSCMQPNNKKSLCVKAVTNPLITQDLIDQAVNPWQGSQLKTYATLKDPVLTFNSGFSQMWNVNQKAWLHVGSSNKDYVVYETQVSKTGESVSLAISFLPDSGDLDLIMDVDGKNLWMPESLQAGSDDQYVKSNVHVLWRGVEDQK